MKTNQVKIANPLFFRRFGVLSLMLVGALTLLASCDPLGIRGTGPLVHDARQLEEFDRVHISVPARTELVLDTVFRVEVQIEESLLPYLETEVRNGRLDVYFSRNVRNVDDLELIIHAPAYYWISQSGSGSATCYELLDGSNLRLEVSGSGSMLFNQVSYDKLRTDVSGSGRITVRGEADHLEAYVSGSGRVDVQDCPVKTAEVHISGSGDIYCNVTDLLEAHVSGSGTVWFEGDPQVDSHISGSGRVRKL